MKRALVFWIIAAVLLFAAIGMFIDASANKGAAAVALIGAVVLGVIGFIRYKNKDKVAENKEQTEAAPAKASKKQPNVIREMDVEVWGTRYTNEDKTSRQTYVAKLKEGEDLFFHPAQTDEYPDTIGVFTAKREQIGFVDYKTLNELRGLYANNKASVSVKEVTHSERGLGVIMHIKIYE